MAFPIPGAISSPGSVSGGGPVIPTFILQLKFGRGQLVVRACYSFDQSRVSPAHQLEGNTQMATKLECINPILPVCSIRASLDYYVSVLGFEKAEWVTDDSVFALVLRDGFGIYLSEDSEKRSKAWVWIGVENVEPLYDEYRASGASIQKPPTNYSWAYEMQVEDPDGHVLRIGSEPKEGLAFND
jgi:predicted lactoylglutathione lyase